MKTFSSLERMDKIMYYRKIASSVVLSGVDEVSLKDLREKMTTLEAISFNGTF